MTIARNEELRSLYTSQQSCLEPYNCMIDMCALNNGLTIGEHMHSFNNYIIWFKRLALKNEEPVAFRILQMRARLQFKET
jgi:hypothetical protein